MAEVTMEKGRELIAGFVTTRQIPLAIDTYYIGMRLEYQGDVAVGQTGTGNEVLSNVIAGPDVPVDVYTLTFTAALVFDLTNAAGDVLAQDLTINDGGARTFTVEGLTFTVTDGGTAFIATDTLVATVTTGEYVAIANGALAAIYNGTDERVLSSAGVDDCIVGGEISKTGLKTDADAAVTLTEGEIAAYAAAGFYIKEN